MDGTAAKQQGEALVKKDGSCKQVDQDYNSSLSITMAGRSID